MIPKEDTDSMKYLIAGDLGEIIVAGKNRGEVRIYQLIIS